MKRTVIELKACNKAEALAALSLLMERVKSYSCVDSIVEESVIVGFSDDFKKHDESCLQTEEES